VAAYIPTVAEQEKPRRVQYVCNMHQDSVPGVVSEGRFLPPKVQQALDLAPKHFYAFLSGIALESMASD